MKKCMIAIAIGLLSLIIWNNSAYAKTSVQFEDIKDTITFGKHDSPSENYYITEDSYDIIDALSSDQNIAIVSYDYNNIYVKAISEGNCTITVTGSDMQSTVIKVNVTAEHMKSRLTDELTVHGNWYGSDYLELNNNWYGINYKVVIGKDTYYAKQKTKLNNDAEDGLTRIKLKRKYKVNTKIYVTASVGKYSSSFNDTFYSNTCLTGVKISGKKTLRISGYNLHKGDIIKVQYKGKTYKKKIKYNTGTTVHTIKMKLKRKKKISKKGVLKLTVYSKYRQKLFYKKIKLKKGKWSFSYWDMMYW